MSEPKITLTIADFGCLFANYQGKFKMIAYRYVRSDAVAEDLVSDSFMAFWENRDKIPGGANLPAYILVIVRNKCLDYLRAQSLHQKIEHEMYQLRQQVLAADIRSLQAFNPNELFSEEVASIVQRALEDLPKLTRDVFVAHRFDDMTYKEIADKHRITSRRVEFEITKAVKQLRIALKDYLPAFLILVGDSMMRS